MTHVGEMHISWGLSHPTARGSAPALPNFECSIYVYTICHRTTKFDVVTYVVEGRVSLGQPRLQSQDSGVLGLRNCWGSPAYTL